MASVSVGVSNVSLNADPSSMPEDVVVIGMPATASRAEQRSKERQLTDTTR